MGAKSLAQTLKNLESVLPRFRVNMTERTKDALEEESAGLAGTMCEGEPSGTSAQQLSTCLECEFLDRVHIEESRHFVLTPLHHSRLSPKEM